MPIEITMPQQSDTMTEGTVVKWLKKEGEAVKAGEMVAEIETDKAVMEMESFEAGTLAAVVAKEGQKVPVGGVIGVLAKKGEDVGEIKKKYAGGAKGAAAPSAKPQVAAGSGARAPAVQQTAGRVGSQPAPATQIGQMEAMNTAELKEPDEMGHGATREKAQPVPALPAHGGGNGEGDRNRVSPIARRIAQEKGVDLSQVQGSGPGGRVVQRDVMEFIEQGGGGGRIATTQATGGASHAAPLPARVASGQAEKVPLSKMRQAIATALQRSKQNVPHFYETIDIDVEELTKLRERLNARLEKEKIRLSIGDFVTQAVASALKRHPALNATFDAQANEVTRHGDVHLGIAVALPDGLIVPVLRNVDQMGLREIRQRSVDIVERARAQRLKQDEMRGATFTVSNLGAYGVHEFMAIINPPEVGILAVGAAEKRAAVKDGQVVARTMMTVTISADHRVVDGATAADFLRTLKETLEEPGTLLL
jgi:pyruvate dehydrogenase E2 component (dihydrolipoamide acetyltransferase)